jgi:hypothetical protein
MEEQKNINKKILFDHKRVGKKLIPPLKADLKVQEVSSSKTAQPEILWLAILNKKYGVKWTANFSEILTKVLKEVKGEDTWFKGTTEYKTLSPGEGATLRYKLNEKGVLEPLRDALEGFVALYPQCPLQVFFEAPPILKVDKAYLEMLRELVGKTSDKRSTEGIFMQAVVLYMGFISGKFKVVKEVSLSDFPEIENYPNTEKSKEIGGAICSATTMLFNFDTDGKVDREWCKYFWNRGLELEPVDLSGLGV